MKIRFFHKDLDVEDQGDQKQTVLLINYTLSSIFISSFVSLVNKRKTSPEAFSTEFWIYNVFGGKKNPKTKQKTPTKKQTNTLKNMLVLANRGTW